MRVARTPLTMDEVSALGFAPNVALQLAEGPHRVPLEWIPPVLSRDGEPNAVEQRPESGSSEVQLGIELQPDSAQLVREEDTESATLCREYIEIEASATLATSGGALDERFEATLSIESPDAVRLDAALSPAELSGSYVLDPTAVIGARWTDLDVMGLFTRYGASGVLFASVQVDQQRQTAQVAGWPSAAPCPDGGSPMQNMAERPSLEDLLRVVNGANPMGLYTEGTFTAPLELRATSLAPWGCFTPGQPIYGQAASWVVSTELAFDSDALPSRPKLPVTVTEQLTPSGSLTASLSPPSECVVVGFSEAEFAHRCGDWGLDLSQDDVVELSLQGNFSGAEGVEEGQGEGEVRVRGLRPAERGGFRVVELGRVQFGTTRASE